MDPLAIKPGLVRADTLDLQQAQPSASAKDHSRQYGYNHAGGTFGNSGAHHIQALRHATQEAFSEQKQSPRVDHLNHDHMGHPVHLYDDEEEEDDIHSGLNGIHHDEDYGEDGDSQDELDDEMLDKISSSPSIEDGKPISWPARADSLHLCNAPHRGTFLAPALPFVVRDVPPKHGHHQNSNQVSIDSDEVPTLAPTATITAPVRARDVWQMAQSDSINDISRHLLPDPFLDDAESLSETEVSTMDDEWEDEDDIHDDCASSDDDSYRVPFTNDARYLDSGWGGECLREIEDIDFEFVYALHTFVATVEGQANATKGDTMVLLDDSNSYWWLVRVVKDGSIGYLPAEHIETPTERLARLNKHRNIDLSAAMLGDDPAKSKNPLKKAMRRRNAKNVNFAPPTYYEPPEQDWSDDDEEMEDVDDVQATSAQNASSDAQQQDAQQVHSDTQAEQQAQREQQSTDLSQQPGIMSKDSMVEPVVANVQQVHSGALDNESTTSPTESMSVASSVPNNSEDTAQRSRKGVVRNTDSFYRDDSVETKKISLTPQLLRGDSAINVNADQEPREGRSVEPPEKAMAEDKARDGKPKKERKGMLSGLFKRKDKSGRPARADDEERVSDESGRSPPSKESAEFTDVTPERRPSKLQKTPQGAAAALLRAQAPTTQGPNPAPNAATAAAPTPSSGMSPIDAGPAEPAKASHSKQLSKDFVAESQHPPGRFPSLNEKRSVFSPITTALRSKNSNPEVGDTVKPVYAKRAKERFVIDDSGSEDDGEDGKQASAIATKPPTSTLHRSISPLNAQDAAVPRSNSIARVSPLAVETEADDAPFTREVSNATESNVSKSLPMQSSPTRLMSQTPTAGHAGSPSEQTISTSKDSPATTQTSTTSRLTPTWSDASLRSYMDNDQDIRDLLVIVHDKSNVTPVGPDHPLMKNLFVAERSKLNDMQSQLDSMLVGWLAKRGQPVAMRA